MLLWGVTGLVMRILALVMLILLIFFSPASAYGRSVEDLVGSFSVQKTVKLASSIDCISSQDTSDPLIPPQSYPSALADDQAPSLAGFAFEPAFVPVNASRTVNFTAHIIDDQCVWASAAYFSSPSGSEKARVLFAAQDLTSGTNKDGYYSSRALMPNVNETGYWHLDNITLVDRESNRRILWPEDLSGMGLPTTIAIKKL
ncbi:Uncharacterised protein [uncultured archaeon]|nr:Uncharacterised protein [uncultured archaeon]